VESVEWLPPRRRSRYQPTMLLVDVYEIRRCGRSDRCSLGLAVFILFLRSFELDMAVFLIGVKVLHIGRV
jgi:hypothetical protein